ncbi:MAG: winged helix-turn-helix domain-containing protein [Acidobacteriaceae bacterium]|nr:winged helix-turn-helix domain-containing protein [Acidobacteriaceae bacterium]
MAALDSKCVVRFANFELDLKTGELSRSGIRLPVQGRPLQVLAVLLRHPGEVVTSEQLRTELWPADTFVDFEHGVRNAVARLRAALRDNADRPRYIETLPRRGYRFIGKLAEAEPVLPAAAPNHQTATPAARKTRWRAALAVFVLLASVGTWVYRIYAGLTGAEIRSIAVLPLENLSADASQDFFVDGITDELITTVAKIASLQVISRTSIMRYKSVHDKTLPQIARELGADAVLEGTLVRSGERVRLTVQLIQAATDKHIWADRYDRSVRDMPAVENEIASAIAEHLRGKLSEQERHRLSANAVDPAAYEAYLRGRYFWNRRTRASLNEALAYFSQAIERDARYAPPYAGRADVYIVLGGWAMEALPPRDAFAKAKSDAEKAVELDGESAEAHTSLGAVRQVYAWDWRSSESEFRRAIELSPRYSTAHQWYGNLLCNTGRFEECLAETQLANTLDPAYLMAALDVGMRLYEARRFQEAIDPVRKVVEFNPDFSFGRRYLGQVYEANGLYDQAIAEFEKSRVLSGGGAVDTAALGHAYGAAGRRRDALRELQKLTALSKRAYVSSYWNALIWVGLGEKQRALDALQQAYDEHSSSIARLRSDPRLDPLHGEARFGELLRRVGLGE